MCYSKDPQNNRRLHSGGINWKVGESLEGKAVCDCRPHQGHSPSTRILTKLSFKEQTAQEILGVHTVTLGELLRVGCTLQAMNNSML